MVGGTFNVGLIADGKSSKIGFRLSFQYTNNTPTNLNFTTLTIAENQPADLL